MARKYQFGGGDFFNSVADMANQEVDQQWAEFQQSQQPLEEAAPEEDPYADYDPGYEELSEKYAELEEKFNALSSRQTMNFAEGSFNDGFLDFLFSEDDNGPIDFDNLDLDDEGLPAQGSGSYSPQSRQPQRSLQMEISKREGNYGSVSPNSSGTGKYQFIWSIHGPNIQKVTGVRSREEFLRSPQAQEQFFQHWDQTTLSPEAERLLPQLRRYYPDITADQAKMMIHFGGAGNVQKAIRSGDFRSPLDANGTSLEGYVFRQFGGAVAATPQEQYVGLNNPAYDELFFPTTGTNTFRGLDSGEPVYLRDEAGNEQILYGPQHTAQMSGPVYEKRISKKYSIQR